MKSDRATVAGGPALPGPRVLVTGGAGFVGAHVCDTLLALGCDVTVLDAHLRFAPAETPAGALTRPLLATSIPVIPVDLRDRKAVYRVLTKMRPEIVIHLAAVPLLAAARDDPALAVAINVDGSRNLLDALAAPGTVRRFVFLSSSTVYGDFRYRPVDEGHPTEPGDVYGRTKLVGEQLTRLCCAMAGIEHVVLRPSAIYGPGDHNRRVVQLFLEQALAGRPLTIDQDGSARLDFTYVKDLAAGVALAAFADSARDETFNLSRGEERTILELAEAIRGLVPGTRLVRRPSRCKRPSRGQLSTEKACQLLGYRPRFALEDGLADYLTRLNLPLAEAV